jgi:hypothetical protein
VILRVLIAPLMFFCATLVAKATLPSPVGDLADG